ncbi:MAG: ABC transporter substrate-binding protein [Acidobacteriaceae bacterium]
MLDIMRVLRVGIDDAPPAPMQIGSPDAASFQGYEVDLLERIAAELNSSIVYRRALWSVIVGELISGKIDAICSAASVTPERAEQVDFCSPHLGLKLGLVVREGQHEAPRVLGVRRGTTAESYVKRMSPAAERVVISESNEQLYEALRGGELDGVVDDSPIARYFSSLKSGLRYITSYAGTEAEYAIAVRKGNDELRLQINAQIAKLEAEGTLEDFRRRWFGTSNFLIA